VQEQPVANKQVGAAQEHCSLAVDYRSAFTVRGNSDANRTIP
jgi:hypothetical protein